MKFGAPRFCPNCVNLSGDLNDNLAYASQVKCWRRLQETEHLQLLRGADQWAHAMLGGAWKIVAKAC